MLLQIGAVGLVALLFVKGAGAFLNLPGRVREGPAKTTLVKRFYAIDRDHSKAIDFSEFVAFCTMSDVEWRVFHAGTQLPGGCAPLSRENVHAAIALFHKFDFDNSGYLDKAEFLAHYPKQRPLFGVIDRSGDSLISASEFLSYLDGIHNGRMSDAQFKEQLQLMYA